ncbi:hypothetical protein [Bacteroides heparinolyticus]|uniref:hypothetical protein n=1 Tax=Prevotella heparinolytica TaxID=28113 RepID=UPI00359FC7D8
MKVEIKTKREIDVKYLKLDAGVRYFEDAEVNGVQDDEDNPTIPFAVLCDYEYRWMPTIDIETGQIVDWPKGTTADVHYKVCDDGTYSLLDKDKNVLIEVSSYVPGILCPKEEGYGDYIIMDIDEDGYIADWECNQRLIDNLIRGDFNYEED